MGNVEFNLNIKSKEEGSKFRIPTADDFVEAIRDACNSNSQLTPFVDKNEFDISDRYREFAAYFRKFNGSTIDAAIYIAVHITFDPEDMRKFHLSITHSKLEGLEQVDLSWGNPKLQKENENV